MSSSLAFKVVIPCRFAATRLPGKPLRDLAGKPLLQHVFERASESAAEEVIIATDDERIRRAARNFGAEVCMTRQDHKSGTDRIAEVMDTFSWPAQTIVVNLQGDEPLMPARLIDQVASDMAGHRSVGMTTLATPIETHDTLFDPHVVKVVTDQDGYALYFSRAPIPWHRDEFLGDRRLLPTSTAFLRHIGLYAYRADFLQRFVRWQPAPLESAESLEQLRVLWHGEKIHVSKAQSVPGHGVDTEDDLRQVEKLFAG